MRFRSVKKIPYILLVFLVFLSSYSFGQDGKRIDVEWIWGEEAAGAQSVPQFTWLGDNKILLFDVHKPKEEQTFEILDPENGSRIPAMDMGKAVANLKGHLGEEKAPKNIPWPLAFDKLGQIALYMFAGDIFVLDIADARFDRITDTEEAELGPVLSPDGKKIAYVRVNEIYVYDLGAKRESQVTFDSSETLYNGRLSFMYWEDVFYRNNGVGLWWSPDSRALAYMQTDVSQVTELVYYDIKPFNPRVIKQRYPLVGETMETVRVGVLDLPDGKTTWLKGTGTPNEYIVNVDWLPDSRRISFRTLNRAQNELDLYIADRSTGRSNHILHETDEAWVNASEDLYFLKDGEHFIWGSERSGYKHLYLYSLDGKLVTPITKGDWAVRGPFQVSYWFGKSAVSIDERNKLIYFTALEKSSLERHLYRIRFDGTDMKRLTWSDGFHSPVFSPDSNFYLEVYSNIASLPSLALYKNDGTLIMTICAPKNEIFERHGVQTPELFTITAFDGFEMPAMIYKPRDFDPKKKYPVILYHYGGPSAPVVINQWQRYAFFNQILLDHGYLCVTVDNRSATAVSKKLENLVLNQMVGPQERSDLMDAVKWLKNQTYVDPGRVGMWGWSYGGCYTLMGMTQSREFKAGIAVAPVSDQRFHEPKWAEFAMKTPQENAVAWEKVSLLKYAKDLHGRLLIVHGTYDDNVRIQNTWAFVDELIRAGKNFDMMIYPMRKHGISDTPARIHLFKKMVEFWMNNL
ncbi:MAG: S9 family peptidase [Candidatus Aminicenantes bacterium]|nr:S9 family peptidase [Candidatus Aminicenantes bacterium]